MMLHKPIHIKKWLLPISFLYGLGVSLRNNFFKWGIYKQKEYNVPIICVGNISVGGTGKTPHTEYLVRLLKDKYKVAVLSRGYKRKTDNYVLATTMSTVKEIGDEPFQIKQKFPDIIVAVDTKRTRGIEHLLSLPTPPEVIILDDGFQHRYVKPSYSIVLSDFNRPVYEDKLLPAGRLRESADKLRVATDIIITKCPEVLQPIDFRIISKDVNVFPYQGLYFTTFVYKRLEPLFNSGKIESLDLKKLKDKHVLLVTGIASPKPLLEKITEYAKDVIFMQYKDHHSFTNANVKSIIARFNKIDSDEKIIILSEKDAIKFRSLNIKDEFKFFFYYLPIEISFLEEGYKREFDKKIIDHVKKYRANS